MSFTCGTVLQLELAEALRMALARCGRAISKKAARDGGPGGQGGRDAGWTGRSPPRYRRPMSITATIMNTATGQPIQKMIFGRMPKPWVSFNLETGELVTADRVEVGKPAPGKFAVPVSVWVTPKK